MTTFTRRQHAKVIEMKFSERLKVEDYNNGYLAGVGLGRARVHGSDGNSYDRGYLAGMVALWFGVSLFEIV